MTTVIIIADSSPTIRKTASIALDSFDLQIENMACRSDLDERLQTADFDVVLFGFSDQGFDKEKMLEGLSKDVLAKTVLLYPEIQGEDSSKKWASLGFKCCLPKPFSASQLVDEVSKVCSLEEISNNPTSSVKPQEMPVQITHVFAEQEKILNERSGGVKSPEEGNVVFKVKDLAEKIQVDLSPTSDLDQATKDFIKEQVRVYCKENFSVIAKEVLSEELQKLSSTIQENPTVF